MARDRAFAASVFVGREEELAAVGSVMATQRLTVLTGLAGTGKTRLARELAARCGSGFPDGAHFVELAALSDPALVQVAVARSLSVWEHPERPLIESLVARLRSQRLLLILDNCEHVRAACAELSMGLLAACPELTILATSQAALDVDGEHVHALAPLAVPAPGTVPELLAGSEAVSLFCTRAAAANPEFSSTPENLEVVAEICRRLDGIPLAIELAAARMILLTAADMAARLDRRFAVLGAGDSAFPPRHQTLRLALDWSYNLLSEPEQRLLRELSVFAGGWGRDAVRMVCGRRADAIGSLTGLIAKSLVQLDGPTARPRYRMLETVRLFAAEHLAEAGETKTVRARHARWCLTLAERAEPALTGRDQSQWFERLDVEHENLRAALSWAQAEGEAESALRLAGALTIFWRVRGHFQEGLRQLTMALELGRGQPDALRAKALWGAGFMALMLGNLGAGQRACEESLALARQEGDRSGQARALLILGNAAGRREGGHAAALELLSESADVARAEGDGWCLAHALGMAGFVHLRRGDVDVARPLLAESIAQGRRDGSPQSMRIGLLVMGEVARTSGELDLAESLFTEAFEAMGASGEPFAACVALGGLGDVAASRGARDRARVLLEASLALAHEMESRTSIRDSLLGLARLAQGEGDLRRAQDLYRQAHEISITFSSLRGLGEVASSLGERVSARHLLNDACERARQANDTRELAEGLCGLARLARKENDLHSAVSLYSQALGVLRHHGDSESGARALEDLAGLAVQLGFSERAARLFGIAGALRERSHYARPPAQQAMYEADLAAVRERLGPEAFDSLWRKGAELPPARALAYAVRWKGTRGQNAGGSVGLTRSERQVANLVAGGMSRAEVAARLAVSPATVHSHVTRIYAKLGINSRKELSGGLYLLTSQDMKARPAAPVSRRVPDRSSAN